MIFLLARQRRTGHRPTGFTLIELMVVVAVIAILASIALPAYDDYIRRSRARTAASDLASLSLVVENLYQRNLSYPTATEGTKAADYISGNAGPSWSGSQSQHFTYTVKVDATSYDLKATGVSTGMNAGCVINLSSVDSTPKFNGDKGCGGL